MYLILEARRLQKAVTALETADIYCEVCPFSCYFQSIDRSLD